MFGSSSSKIVSASSGVDIAEELEEGDAATIREPAVRLA